MNKKIKNATPRSYNGIDFKSSLELTIYKTLIENGFSPSYEGFTFDVSPKITSEIPFYTHTKKKGFHKDSKIVRPITYTPDFMFNYKDITVVVEAKGMKSDVYPYKRNLFRKLLETLEGRYVFFEVYSKRDMLEAINILRNENFV